MSSNSTEPVGGGPNMGKPQFASHTWLEPIIVVSIMIGSLIINRRRGYRIFHNHQRGRSPTRSLLPGSNRASRSPSSSSSTHDSSSSSQLLLSSRDPYPAKIRSCCGLTTITTPNTSRFANNIHSRILAKFPFLIEMFYWALNFAVYALTKILAANFLTRGGDVWDLAQRHGEGVLWVEHESWFLHWLFPVTEVGVQTWFLTSGREGLITFLNRIYSLVHIPGTVLFLSWYYHSAPSFPLYATVRRTMTLGNFFAFFIFTLWPCMPPRLLPKHYGFHDTVRQGNAESVFVGGKYVNELAAMPSLHFTYAFVIGCTFIWHSGLFGRWGWGIAGEGMGMGQVVKKTGRRSPIVRIAWVLLGIAYPLLVLTVIVATANHYFLDALVAMGTVTLSLCINKVWFVLLPAEDWLAWGLRVDKPRPTTGDPWCRGGEGGEGHGKRRGWKEGEQDEP